MAYRFALMYLVWLGVLFGVFYWDLSPLAHAPNAFLQEGLLSVLDAGLRSGQVQGADIWINPHYKLIIGKACDGAIPVLMYLASILAYPTHWKRKMLWGVAGSVGLLLVNVARIFIVTWSVMEGGRGAFPLSHDVLGNALLMITGLGMFYGFARVPRTQIRT